MADFFKAIIKYPSGLVLTVHHMPSNLAINMPCRDLMETKAEKVIIKTSEQVHEFLMNSTGCYNALSPISGEWPDSVEVVEARDATPADIEEGKAVLRRALAGDPGKAPK